MKAARILNTKALPLKKFNFNYNYRISIIVNWLTINDIEWLGHEAIIDYVKLTLLSNSDIMDYEDLNTLAQISNNLEEKILSQKIRDLLLEYWQEYIHTYIFESNEFDDFYDLDNSERLESKARDLVKDLLSESSLIFEEHEIDDIMHNVNAYDVIERNIQNSSEWNGHDFDDHNKHLENGFDAVDDLFLKE